MPSPEKEKRGKGRVTRKETIRMKRESQRKLDLIMISKPAVLMKASKLKE